MYQSKANLDVKILFGKVTHPRDPEVRKKLSKFFIGNLCFRHLLINNL